MEFLDIPKAQPIQEIIDKLNFFKIKNFCSVKVTPRIKLGEKVYKSLIWQKTCIQNKELLQLKCVMLNESSQNQKTIYTRWFHWHDIMEKSKL